LEHRPLGRVVQELDVTVREQGGPAAGVSARKILEVVAARRIEGVLTHADDA
jgi:hypothetical protein